MPIDEQVDGKTLLKRNRFVELSGGIRTVSGELEARARALAGLQVHITHPAGRPGGTPVTADLRHAVGNRSDQGHSLGRWRP